MKFTNIEDVNAFLAVVDQCKGEVYLKSEQGDQFALKSKFSRYIAMGALLSEHGDELELYCEFKEDEPVLLKFLSDNQHVI
ncbi:MAG: polya polymerase [Oscillospiraceae bacterium]|nr:polya polymerase [Oscillospiraceae bacterium]